MPSAFPDLTAGDAAAAAAAPLLDSPRVFARRGERAVWPRRGVSREAGVYLRRANRS